jgi:hypothetical protein
MIEIQLHANIVHPFDWLLTLCAPPLTGIGGSAIGVNNNVRRNVDTITSNGQCNGIAERIAFLFYNGIVPTYEIVFPKLEQCNLKTWSKGAARLKEGEMKKN